MEIFCIRFVGITAENGRKLLLTVGFILVVLLVSYVLKRLAALIFQGFHNKSVRFWTEQGISLVVALLMIVGILSIWFDDPARLTTAIGLVTAGLAFALQKVVTSLAGYIVILRGNTFSVGDRITMGGVRGGVVALGFIQTTIMEMGQPPAVQSADPAMWVKSRQFTGRIVTVSNSRIFDEPVYNYTRDFPFIWEEISLPITYRDDRSAAEKILLDATRRNTEDLSQMSEEAERTLEQKYYLQIKDLEPRVFYRLTDNWLELTARFVVRDHGSREVKDAISRELLSKLDKAGIGIASSTYEIVGFPPLKIESSGENNSFGIGKTE